MTERRARRPHPALGARIVATGAGATTMLGIVATMGVAAALENATEQARFLTLVRNR